MSPWFAGDTTHPISKQVEGMKNAGEEFVLNLQNQHNSQKLFKNSNVKFSCSKNCHARKEHALLRALSGGMSSGEHDLLIYLLVCCCYYCPQLFMSCLILFNFVCRKEKEEQGRRGEGSRH